MLSETLRAPQRLKEYLVFTRRYRIGVVVLGVAWFVVFHGLGMPLESGAVGSWLLGTFLGLNALMLVALPRLAAWWIESSHRPVEQFYALVFLWDTALAASSVALTGGVKSITYIFYYYLAIGTCYMFRSRGALLANSVMGGSYLLVLALMPAGEYAPTLFDWIDIVLVRVPMIFLVTNFARWLASRGDRIEEEDQQQYLDTLNGFLQTIEARDGYTRQHSMNVARWSEVFATHLGLPSEERATLSHAGELHDIGKIGIPDSILNKPGRLTPEEYQKMKEHAHIGWQIAQHLRWFDRRHLDIIRYHHERWDGKGYPDRLGGKAIPYLTRVLSLCDVFDAVVGDRPYRRGMGWSTALSIIEEGRGTQFDPILAERFLALVRELLALLNRHVTVVDCLTTNWTEEDLSILVRTPDGHVTVTLRPADRTWELLSITQAETEAAGA